MLQRGMLRSGTNVRLLSQQQCNCQDHSILTRDTVLTEVFDRDHPLTITPCFHSQLQRYIIIVARDGPSILISALETTPHISLRISNKTENTEMRKSLK